MKVIKEPEIIGAITPLSRPVGSPHEVTSPWGDREIWLHGKKVRHTHTGIDYVCRGTDRYAYAIADGVVHRDLDNYCHELRWDSLQHSAGAFIVIESEIHGLPIWVRYLHLDKNYVEPGQVIHRGQKIGEWGTIYPRGSGRANGSHIHLDWLFGSPWGPTYNFTRHYILGLKASGEA